MPTLSRSKQDYLKAIYVLAPQGGGISTSSLAARLGVSAPSVTKMLGRLAGERLVRHTPRAGARLTPDGRRAAIEMVRRHRILETFLVRILGLDWSEVHEDAEVLEHHISDRVLEAIDRLVGHPAEDPHGHLIPDRHGRIVPRALRAARRAAARRARDRARDPRRGPGADGALEGTRPRARAPRFACRRCARWREFFELEVARQSFRERVAGTGGGDGRDPGEAWRVNRANRSTDPTDPPRSFDSQGSR